MPRQMKIDGHRELHPNLSLQSVPAIRGRSGQILGYFLRNQRNEHLLLETKREISSMIKTTKNKHWKEYFQELLNPETTSEELPPDIEEIIRALSKLKNHKSPGLDEINNELLKNSGVYSTAWLHVIFEKAETKVKVPEDLLKSVAVILDKKGDTSYCNNTRGIAVLLIPSKVFQIVILQRLDKCTEKLLRDNQCGFHKSRLCADQLFALRKIIEGCI